MIILPLDVVNSTKVVLLCALDECHAAFLLPCGRFVGTIRNILPLVFLTVALPATCDDHFCAQVASNLPFKVLQALWVEHEPLRQIGVNS
jgi:hypothetical protein